MNEKKEKGSKKYLKNIIFIFSFCLTWESGMSTSATRLRSWLPQSYQTTHSNWGH